MAELIFPDWFDEKTTIAPDDYILMADSEDNNKIKKAKYSFLKWEKWEQGEQWEQWIQWEQWPQWEQGIQWEQWPAGQDWQDGQDGTDWQDGQDGTDWASIVSWTFVGNDLVFGKDDWTNVIIENAKTTLQWPEWEEWPEWPEWPAWNWIESVTTTKAWKVTTVTITETDWTTTQFQVSDWQDWQGSWDVIWPNSSTNEDIVLFDWTDGKHIKGGTKKLSDLVQTAWNQTIWGTKTFSNEPVLPGKTADATNDGTKPATEAQVYKKQDKIDATHKLDADLVDDTSSTNKFVTAWDKTTWNWKQNAITNLNKLDADLVDDTNSTNKFVTASEKNTWNGKQNAIDNNNKLSADLVSNGTNNRVCVVGATAPSTPSEWDLWYDTANDVLKSYNGSTWDEAGGSGGWIQNLPWSPITINYKWSWSKAEFEALATYRADTEYNVIG